MKQTTQKLIALAICVIFIAASILSAGFILNHLDHEHDHNGPDGSCATCLHLAAAGNWLKSIAAALAGAAFICWCLYAILSTLKSIDFHAGFHTLVRLKVRLNN